MRETWVQFLGQEDTLEKGMATHTSILAWRIPWIEEPVQGKGYLARVKDTLWVRDVLGTELVPGHQSLNVIVELHDAAVVLDPEDKAVCLQTRLGIIIAGNGRKFGLNQGFLQGHHELLGFRVTKQNLGTGYWLSPSHPLLSEPLQEGVSATP